MWNWKKSSAAISRRPAGPSAITLPSRRRSTIGISAAASAWQRLPTTVPRLRIGMWATCARASRISGLAACTASFSSSSRCRVIALTTILPSFDRGAGEAADVLDVDEARRAREPEVHRRDEALAAGEDCRSGIGGEKRHGVADRLRSAVLEERRLHSLPFDAKRFTARPETMRRRVTPAASFDPPKAVSRPHPPGEVITMTCPISIHILDSVFQMTILIEFAPCQ